MARAVALDPNNPWYHVRLSDFLIDYAKGGTMARPAPLRRRAAREADIARRLAPASPEPYLALAKAGLAMRDEGGAAEALNRALEIDPQNHRAHQLMGRTALAKGLFSKAGDHFMDAGRLEPHDANNATLLRLASGRWLLKLALVAVVLAFLLQLHSGTNGEQLLGLRLPGWSSWWWLRLRRSSSRAGSSLKHVLPLNAIGNFGDVNAERTGNVVAPQVASCHVA